MLCEPADRAAAASATSTKESMVAAKANSRVPTGAYQRPAVVDQAGRYKASSVLCATTPRVKSQASTASDMCNLTFDMSGVTRQAKPAVARPLDGGVRPHGTCEMQAGRPRPGALRACSPQ